MELERALRETEVPGEAVASCGDRVWETPGAASRRFLVYSVTKTYLAVVVLQLGLELDAPVRRWIDDPRLPAEVTLRRLLNHTSGVPDYGRLPAYADAVRGRPASAWSDDELLDLALAQPAAFPPGEGWDYSNTGYLLVRRVVDLEADGGFTAAVGRQVLVPLGLDATEVPELPVHLPDGTRYDPRWVGHRTLLSTAADQLRFWTALAGGELGPLETLADFTGIGAAPGFVRPGYGLGLMVDPDHPGGRLVGHGGGGPGYAAGAFALLRPMQAPAVAVVLAERETAPAQEAAMALVRNAAVRIP